MSEVTRTLIQCDFDGTIAEEDVSFMMLDAFASGDWRRIFREYEESKISVGQFNAEAFAMVDADRASLLESVRDRYKVRQGFQELIDCCRRKGFRFVIVSNGLDFYIKEILRDIGLADIEVHAAQTTFRPDSIRVQYIGPDGNRLDSNFKLSYVNSFLREGYRIAYVGNGTSDIVPAKECHHVFATGTLLAACRQASLDCMPFTDFNEVVRVLERW